jgi:hypothetical protein
MSERACEQASERVCVCVADKTSPKEGEAKQGGDEPRRNLDFSLPPALNSPYACLPASLCVCACVCVCVFLCALSNYAFGKMMSNRLAR